MIMDPKPKQVQGKKLGHAFYSELFSLERCLLSVTLPCGCWKTHRNCKPQIRSCPSASHNMLLCVAQAEIQSAWEADEWFGAQLWSERWWVSPWRYLLCCCASRQSNSSFGETWWCICCTRMKCIYAQWWRGGEASVMTTEQRTWKALGELGGFYLFMCKNRVSAVTVNELPLCRQTDDAEQSEGTEGWK